MSFVIVITEREEWKISSLEKNVGYVAKPCIAQVSVDCGNVLF